jgi:two-component system NarL family sensor kinase
MSYPGIANLLKFPLAAKLVGAQAIVVALCGALVMSLGWRPEGREELVLLAVAGMSGLPITIGLVALALRPLRQLEETALRFGQGEYDARVPDMLLADRSMARLAKTFNTLLDHVDDDRSRLRDLTSAVIRSGDEERSRTAIELHESAAQSIASVSWQLGALARDVSDKDLEHRLLFVKRLTEDVLEDVRQLAEAMHPRVLTDLGLAAALTQLARHIESESEIRVTANVDRALARSIDQTVAAALYRTAHEAVWNAIRHAQPKSVRIWLFGHGSTVRLEVIDDGEGFDVNAAERNHRPGTGIFAMRERLALVNASMTVESTPGAGTRVCAYIANQSVGEERSA